MWLDPRPIDDDLGRCYPSGYFTHDALDGAGSPDALLPRLDGWKGVARRHVLATVRKYPFEQGPRGPTTTGRVLAAIPWVRRKATHDLGPLLPPWNGGERLLDVGCGNGTYLAQMRAYGWEVAGQDVDLAAARAATEAHGIDVTTEPLGALAASEPGFDLVTASHVIEHVPDPVGFLTDAARCLRPGGRLIVVTPNAEALGHRWFEGDWFPLQPPQHLAVHTAEGLRNAAHAASVLTGITLSSSARTAGKVYRLSTEARRHGAFRTGAPVPRRDRWGARAFGLAERIASLAGPFGEELFLTARRGTA